MAAWGKCHNYIMTAYITIVFTVIIIYIHYQFSIASLFYCQCHCVLVLLLLVLLLLVLFIIAVLVHHYCHISWLHYYNMLHYRYICIYIYTQHEKWRNLPHIFASLQLQQSNQTFECHAMQIKAMGNGTYREVPSGNLT